MVQVVSIGKILEVVRKTIGLLIIRLIVGVLLRLILKMSYLQLSAQVLDLDVKSRLCQLPGDLERGQRIVTLLLHLVCSLRVLPIAHLPLQPARLAAQFDWRLLMGLPLVPVVISLGFNATIFSIDGVALGLYDLHGAAKAIILLAMHSLN